MTKEETLWEPCPLYWLNTLDNRCTVAPVAPFSTRNWGPRSPQPWYDLNITEINRDNLDLKSLASAVDFTNVRARLDEARHCPMASHGNPRHPTASHGPGGKFQCRGRTWTKSCFKQTPLHLPNVHQIKLRDWLI